MTATRTPTLISRQDVRFLLYDWLRVEELTAHPRYAGQDRDTYEEVLDLAERIAAERFAPHNREADEHEPQVGADGAVVLVPEVRAALEAYTAAGLMGTTMPESVGGMQLPHCVGSACSAYFLAANAGTAGYVFLTAAAGNTLLACAAADQVERWVPAMAEGRWFGTMCLSEPQAGSSLADITTRAVPGDDGTYRVFGTKMWISAGDHELSENIVHLVLAKIPGGPAGVKGISLLIVPRFLVGENGEIGERNDVTLAGLNHKMGSRGTVNTVLGFGEGVHTPGGTAGAVGYLVGEPHRGLQYMFHMMNEARIGVGLGATSLGYTGYLKALGYAQERPQGRPIAQRGGDTQPVPIIQHPDVRRMLLASKSYVEGALALGFYCARLVDEQVTLAEAGAPAHERARVDRLLEILTPIAKSWPSQWCLEANSLAIQVHGGYGYAREYEVEQHYRDNRLNAIHEGTHGIQALDLLGRKVTMDGGAALGALAATIETTVERALAAGGEAASLAGALRAAAGRLVSVTASMWSSGDPERVLANASVYLEAAGHIVLAWIWLEQWLALGGAADGNFAEGKRQAARYFYAFELPRTGPQLDLLERLDRTVLDMRESWF